MRQLEQSAAGGDFGKSCLGPLTMITDHNAMLGWRFGAHPAHAEVMTVTTKAVLPLKTLTGVSA
ncbi:MAG TPA: hypothetical protein VGN17_24860 [Bryobacteraceae bacterium]